MTEKYHEIKGVLNYFFPDYYRWITIPVLQNKPIPTGLSYTFNTRPIFNIGNADDLLHEIGHFLHAKDSWALKPNYGLTAGNVDDLHIGAEKFAFTFQKAFYKVNRFELKSAGMFIFSDGKPRKLVCGTRYLLQELNTNPSRFNQDIRSIIIQKIKRLRNLNAKQN